MADPLSSDKEDGERLPTPECDIASTRCIGLPPIERARYFETLAKSLERRLLALSSAEVARFHCKAHSSYPEPLDCDWPNCGCDPHFERVVRGLQESGWTVQPPPSPEPQRSGCMICGAPYSRGAHGLGPCENGHTVTEEAAEADEQVKLRDKASMDRFLSTPSNVAPVTCPPVSPDKRASVNSEEQGGTAAPGAAGPSVDPSEPVSPATAGPGRLASPSSETLGAGETPRTDAEVGRRLPAARGIYNRTGLDIDPSGVVRADFARQLERELAERNEHLTRWIGDASNWQRRAEQAEAALRSATALRKDGQ